MAEIKAEHQEAMYMKDWLEMLDKFTSDLGFKILETVGNISHDEAMSRADTEYKKYRSQISDELTEVEKAYLETLKEMQKRLEKNQ